MIADIDKLIEKVYETPFGNDFDNMMVANFIKEYAEPIVECKDCIYRHKYIDAKTGKHYFYCDNRNTWISPTYDACQFGVKDDHRVAVFCKEETK